MSQETMDRRERATRYQLTFPSENGLDQDQEWCVVRTNGFERRVRFHDYGDIYDLPGLYEQLFYEHMECRSPKTVAQLLTAELERSRVNPGSLRVFDVGAGNGMMGEEVAAIAPDAMIGVDIIPEAAAAAERDRPGLYDDYFVLDLTELDDDVRGDLESRSLNMLTCVAALGFGDIPPAAFAAAYDVLTPDAWLAFSIKTDFLDEEGGSGFATLIRELVDRGMIEIRARERYRHRLSAAGDPVHYVALVAAKRSPEPAGPIAADL
ncbi:MAG: methyltransferase domain-containing protein [Actinomycetota bacterium]|nr:methyltransferase domain-containing protein [Actinomycetota bacterium]